MSRSKETLKNRSRFGLVMTAILDRRGISDAAFARRLRTSSGRLCNVFRGLRRPPLDQLDEWLNAVGKMSRRECTEDERRAALMAAIIEHCPEELFKLGGIDLLTELAFIRDHTRDLPARLPDAVEDAEAVEVTK